MANWFGSSEEKKEGDDANLLGVASALADRTQKNRSLCPKMSLKTRVQGWAICLCLGFLISLVSAGLIKSLLNGRILKFAILYTAGTICSLASSMFLWGPVAQCKSMFDKTRRITTIIFLLCVVGVILSCVFYPKVPLQVILLLVIIQYCAYFWYCLSYIPWGRKIFCRCFKKAVGDEE